MNVEDIASKISVIFGIQHDWKDQIFGFINWMMTKKTSIKVPAPMGGEEQIADKSGHPN